jgi:hypothetical protein
MSYFIITPPSLTAGDFAVKRMQSHLQIRSTLEASGTWKLKYCGICRIGRPGFTYPLLYQCSSIEKSLLNSTKMRELRQGEKSAKSTSQFNSVIL